MAPALVGPSKELSPGRRMRGSVEGGPRYGDAGLSAGALQGTNLPL